MAWQNNTAELHGQMGSTPELSHISRGIYYYSFTVLTRRLSGTADRVGAIVPGSLLACLPEPGQRVWLRGELRSFNNRSGTGSRLVLYIHAQEAAPAEDRGEDTNEVLLTGALCKEPVWRKTPMGREICDLMLAVNRRYGRSDYLPCIAWGRNAELASAWEKGRRVSLRGRFQSRTYVKVLEDGRSQERTAYEVSVTEFLPGEADAADG